MSEDTSGRSEHAELRMRRDEEAPRVPYLQRGEEPSYLDEVVGMVDTPELAGKIVEAWNAHWAQPEDPTRPSAVDMVKIRAASQAQQELADLEG